ncbi:hypothetical protein DS901_14710 [Loktanella sp. D2R18]|nr:hypothetical protein DS901_14710 [Loktanella sp. D2R18]
MMIRTNPKPATPNQKRTNATFEATVSEIILAGGCIRVINREGGRRQKAVIVAINMSAGTPIESDVASWLSGADISFHKFDWAAALLEIK